MSTKVRMKIIKRLVIGFVVCTCLAVSGDFSLTLAAAKRGLQIGTITDTQGKEVMLYQESYALVIGISNYTNGWPNLPGVAQDVPAVKTALEAQGFNVTTKMNLDRNDLDQAITAFINQYGQKPENRLLFYFAGHGHTMKLAYGGEMGYIVPADAPNPSRDQNGFLANALDMQMFEVYAKRIQAKHALFLFDSCFSGSLFAVSRAMPQAISYLTSKPVRQFMTSGSADEQVPDHSIFREQFIRALQGEADGDHDGYVTGAELGSFLEKTVINYSHNSQHPQYGKIRDPNLDKGDFVFKLPEALTPTPPPAEATNATVAKLVQACERHFRAGRLIGGSGGGALACYQKVLEQDPANTAALDGLDKIEAAYAKQAAQALAKGNQKQAQQALAGLRTVNPESRRLAELEAQLQGVGRPPQPENTPIATPVPILPTPTSIPATPTPPAPKIIRLRSEPLIVSSREAQQVFELDANMRPPDYIQNAYEDRGEVVVNHATGLMWQKSGSDKELMYAHTENYIAQLNRQKFAGYADWRLPTIPERMSLLEPEQQSNDLYINSIFDQKQRWCWSADRQSSSESSWLVLFDGGSVYWDPLHLSRYVRGVRTGQ